MAAAVPAVTVRRVELRTLPDAAVIIDVPADAPVASPAVPVLIEATAAMDELQATEGVRFVVVPFE